MLFYSPLNNLPDHRSDDDLIYLNIQDAGKRVRQSVLKRHARLYYVRYTHTLR